MLAPEYFEASTQWDFAMAPGPVATDYLDFQFHGFTFHPFSEAEVSWVEDINEKCRHLIGSHCDCAQPPVR